LFLNKTIAVFFSLDFLLSLVSLSPAQKKYVQILISLAYILQMSYYIVRAKENK